MCVCMMNASFVDAREQCVLSIHVRFQEMGLSILEDSDEQGCEIYLTNLVAQSGLRQQIVDEAMMRACQPIVSGSSLQIVAQGDVIHIQPARFVQGRPSGTMA